MPEPGPASKRCSFSSRTADRHTQTDSTGAFRIKPGDRGSASLYISVVGYILVRRDVQVAAGSALDITIPLSEGTGTYTENVTVAADRFRAAEPGVASQQVLGSADIQNLRGVLADDPLRAVQVLPGVASADDLRSEFSVRGSPFTHLNMTVDGFSTPYLLHTVRAIEDQLGVRVRRDDQQRHPGRRDASQRRLRATLWRSDWRGGRFPAPGRLA